jgi:hypothetical protein
MIKLHLTFENIDKKVEDTQISGKFQNMDDVHKWLDKVSFLNEDIELKRTAGFIS